MSMLKQEHTVTESEFQTLVNQFIAVENPTEREKLRDSIEAILTPMLLRYNKYELARAESVERFLQHFHRIPFGYSTYAFLHHSQGPVQQYLEKCNDGITQVTHLLSFRRGIEQYLACKSRKTKQDALDFGRQLLKKDFALARRPYRSENNIHLIRNVYLTEDKGLIDLFNTYFPLPKVAMFRGYPIPKAIFDAEQQTTNTLQCITSITRLERAAMKAQRTFRHQQQQKERLSHIQTIEHGNKNPAALFADANTLYRPQKCSTKLAERILKAAKRISLFDSLHHDTDIAALASLLDDGIYARPMTRQHYLPEPRVPYHTLYPSKMETVRFLIHPLVRPEKNQCCVALMFDRTKLIKSAPSLVYQPDGLGLSGKKTYIPLGDNELCVQWGRASDHHVRLEFVDENNRVVVSHITTPSGKDIACTDAARAHVEIPRHLLMPLKLEHMHQLPALNFFRFVDKIGQDSKLKGSAFYAIYKKLEPLSEQDLERFLLALTPVMTQTATLNVDGGYRIQFDALTHIKHGDYTLELGPFVIALNQGYAGKLIEAVERLPEAFASRRFLDYLLTQVHHKTIHLQLFELKKRCSAKPWEAAANEPLRANESLDTVVEQDSIKAVVDDIFQSAHVARFLKKTTGKLDIHVLIALRDYLQHALNQDTVLDDIKTLVAREALNTPEVLNQLRTLPKQLVAEKTALDKEQQQDDLRAQRLKEEQDDRQKFERLVVAEQLEWTHLRSDIEFIRDFLNRQTDSIYVKIRKAWDKLPEFDLGLLLDFEKAFIRTMIYCCHTSLQTSALPPANAKAKRVDCGNVVVLLYSMSEVSIKERLEHDELLSESLRCGAAVLLKPGEKDVQLNVSPGSYNNNLEHLSRLAMKLPGHASIPLLVVSLVLIFIGLATMLAFIFIPSVPVFAAPFVAALHQAGLYNAAATMGGTLGAAAGASIAAEGVGLVSAATGLGLFATNKHQGLAKNIDSLSQVSRIR